MYTSRGFREWEIGDIGVIRRGDLFHLVLPNHDYIAHAVSEDGMNWNRTRNAIFTGEPGSWDDDMLWTMHVSRNPGLRLFEMFYTGLHRAEGGYTQRIGRAVSRDLTRWRKDDELNLPLAPRGPEGFELEEPLFFPRMYDDIECPCLVTMDGWFYLVGSIREDVEVHYWWSDSFRGEYRSFRNNVLPPRGNYAARIMRDGPHTLLFSLDIDGLNVESGTRTLPPPKQLQRGPHGGLQLVSYELFTVPEDDGAWLWEGELRIVSQGRCGLVFGLDDQLNGYFVSLDTTRGFTQIRAWGTKPERIFQNYIYEDLQLATFPPDPEGRHAFSLIRWGSYIELSIDGIVRLTLVDARFKGRNLGIYVESAEIRLSEPVLHALEAPRHDRE